MKKYKIYILKDPRDGRIRYIGLTSMKLNDRLRAHLGNSKRDKNHKGYWLNSLKSLYLKPIIESIHDDIDDIETAYKLEIFYISKYREEGFDLTNTSDGGYIVSESTKEKFRKNGYKRKGTLVLSEDSKKRISISAINRFSNPEERIKQSIANKKYEDSKTEEQKIEDILKQKCKSIIQLDFNGNFVSEYLSIRDAVRKTGIERKSISRCCQHKAKSAGGYIWKYKE